MYCAKPPMSFRAVRLHVRKAAVEHARPALYASSDVRDEIIYRGVSTDVIHAEPKAPAQHFHLDLVRLSAVFLSPCVLLF